jgi:hypothetical protein
MIPVRVSRPSGLISRAKPRRSGGSTRTPGPFDRPRSERRVSYAITALRSMPGRT